MHRSLLVSTFVSTLLVASLAAQTANTVLLPDMFDLRGSAQRATARIAELNAEAALQLTLSNPAAAASIQAITANLQAIRSGTASVPPTAGIEVDVVGFYEGAGASSTAPGTANVVVDRPGSVVALVLNAYEPITWTLTQTPGTVVVAVVSYSYEPQVLNTAGLPGAVTLRLSYAANNDGTYFGVAGSDVTARLTANTWCLERLGVFAHTFTGAYTAPAATFTVGDSAPDWREQWVAGEAARAGDVWNVASRTQLQAQVGTVLFLPLLTPPPFTFGPATVAVASALGVVAPIVPLQGVTDYALGNGAVYTLAGGNPSTLDLLTLQSTPIAPDPTLPPFSWANTIAYDALRDRLLVSSFGGSGVLYAWSALTGTWSVLVGNLQNQEPAAIVHHPLHDAVFGLHVDEYAPVPYQLRRYDAATGALTATLALPLPVLHEGLLDDHQLYTYGAAIAYVGVPREILGFRIRLCYVIDPLTANVLSATFLLG
jgi:hypothetical protein